MSVHEERRGPRGFDLWAPRVTRVLGWGGVVFLLVFWALTGKETALLTGLFGSFAAGGEVLAAARDFRASGPRERADE